MINAAPSITGRYPNLGPQLLVDAGIPLIDDVGADVFDQVKEGQQVRLDGETLYLGDVVVAKGTGRRRVGGRGHGGRQGGPGRAAQGLRDQHLRVHRPGSELLVEGIRMPPLRTRLAGRHALVVARGYHYHEDLQALRAYIREFKPVIIGVDGGANALIEAGYWPRPHRRRHGLGIG